jgi:hypothetical protein
LPHSPGSYNQAQQLYHCHILWLHNN